MSSGENTRAVHGPAFPVFPQVPLGLPVYRSAAFSFDSAQAYADTMNGDVPGYSYSRVDNPTSDTFAQAVAALEGVHVDGEVVGQPFASGMAAISTVLMTFTHAGAHVVAPREVYGGTWGLLARVLARFGVETTFADARDLDAVRAAVRPETTVLWGEVMANPTMTVSDLPGLAAIAREAGLVFAVDATFASPAVCRPLEHGVDVVVHSATKYLGGHSDATGGVAVGRPELLARVKHDRVELGGALAPDEAFLLHRGLATLPLRVDRACRSALAVATAVEGHPAVVKVQHPGLPSDPSHELAVKLFDEGRYGACVTITPRGGRAAGLALCDALSLVENATSLGGVRSKTSHAATSTHRQLDDAALHAAGIDPAAVRVSVGLEDPADLVEDLLRALDTL
ncbi:MAG: cystathionine gamma-synthase [Frankiales bacterium]|nr:cystathionine gamma-synthase [Frankiales bacterium]